MAEIEWYCRCVRCNLHLRRGSTLKKRFYKEHRGCGVDGCSIEHWLYKENSPDDSREAFGPMELLGSIELED